ncbi:30S ribosomal protein S2 [Candidatus Saccharibacteria bacterium]|nr:30S ribosomal protein S2 [Candidatus Saccharibacteria bacterium]
MAAQAVDIKQLLEAGAHFGHKTSRWHPKMAGYIHSKRGDNHIIDLNFTVEGFERAMSAVETAVSKGGQVLFVSTKRQAKDIVKAAAEKVGMPYVTERWLGGMLTNKNTISGRIKHLKDLEAKMASGELANRYNKLEVQRFQEEIDLMNKKFGGIKEMNARPSVVFVVDMNEDENAISEANKLGIPVVALADTNTNPTLVEYPIPCNDDAVKAIQLACDYIVSAVEAGKTKQKTTTSTEK